MNFYYKGIHIWYLDNPNYRWRYRMFIKLTNFLDGVVSVISLGMLACSLTVMSHRKAYLDMVKWREKNGFNNGVMGEDKK